MTGVTGTTFARAVEVDAVVERAFEVFSHMTGWWPPEHRIVPVELREVVIEPAVGGACYQVGVDGSRCDWGRVMVWDPPWRLLIAWHLNSRFEFDPDADRASEVEVTFTALADRRTRVDLEHRRFDRHGPDGDGLRRAVDAPDGWGYVVGRYQRAVRAEGDR